MEVERKMAKKSGSRTTLSATQFYKLLIQVGQGETKLKLLDVMLFDNVSGGKKPTMWMFTDTNDQFHARRLESMEIDDLIKAVLSNIEGGEKPLVHADILVFPQAVSRLDSECSPRLAMILSASDLPLNKHEFHSPSLNS